MAINVDSISVTVRRIENHPTSDGDVPTVPFTIADCGSLQPDDPSLAEESSSRSGGTNVK